jgi:hypothetical protein
MASWRDARQELSARAATGGMSRVTDPATGVDVVLLALLAKRSRMLLSVLQYGWPGPLAFD